MDEKNKVSVRIYGQEYKISGNASKEYILNLANYVDTKIVEVANNMKQYTTPMLTVLAAVNITDEYFKLRHEASHTQSKIERYLTEIKNKEDYIKELKASYLQSKQEAEQEIKTLEEIKETLSQKDNDNELLNKDLENYKVENDNLKQEIEALKQSIEQLKTDTVEKNVEVEKLKKANQELENIYFDTEMLNVQLKKEIEDLTKTG